MFKDWNPHLGRTQRKVRLQPEAWEFLTAEAKRRRISRDDFLEDIVLCRRDFEWAEREKTGDRAPWMR